MTSSDRISWETVQFSYLLDFSAEFGQLVTSYFLTHTGSVVTITLFFSNSAPKFLTVPIQFPLLDSLSSSTDLLNLYEVVISVSMTHLDMLSANLTCLKTYTSNGYLSSVSLVPQIQCMPRLNPPSPLQTCFSSRAGYFINTTKQSLDTSLPSPPTYSLSPNSIAFICHVCLAHLLVPSSLLQAIVTPLLQNVCCKMVKSS